MNNLNKDINKINNIVDSESSEDLRYYKNIFTEIFDNSLSAKLIVDAEKLFIIDVNSTFVEFTNRTREEVIGQSIYTFEVFLSNISIEEIVKSINTDKQYVKVVSSLNYKNVLKHYFLKVSKISFLDKHQLYVTLTDITETHGESQKYHNLLNNAPLGILYTDVEGNINYVNSKMLQMLGSPSQEETMKFNMLTSERAVKSGVSDVYKQCIRTKEKSVFELPYTSKWGVTIYVRFYVNPLFEKSELTGVLVMSEDITELKESQIKENKYKIELESINKNLELIVKERTEELISAKNKAEESDRLKTAFLANMSHEIRTPMNAIIGFTEIISKPNIASTEKSKYIDYINQSGKTLVKLIDDIIDISKIEANQMKIYKTNFSVNNLFEELYYIFEKQINELGKTSVKLSLSISDSDVIIFSDELRLRQIISNLLHNSVKFTQKGSIVFGYIIKGDDVEFFVKDTGDGIDKSKVNTVFDRFVRTEKLNKKGTGIGLSIVKSLTELLDGEIKVASDLHKGTEFRLYFSSICKIDKLIMAKIEKKEYNWSGKTILIVEDDMFNMIILEETLIDTGVNIITAVNGVEAIKLYKQKKSIINIVLMDIQMPEMDGFEASKRILEIDGDVKIIAQTAFANDDENKKIVELGCIGVVNKPIDNDVLYEVIDSNI